MIGKLQWALMGIFFFIASPNIKSQVYINEILASNSTVLLDNDYQQYSDWIELYNAGSSDVNLAGYYISDDILKPLKWQFPGGITITAGGYLIIWADLEGRGTHTNFRLDSEGEQLLLFDNTGILVDSITFNEQLNDISYGRTTDGGNQWSFFTTPSPNLANDTYPQNAVAPTPVFIPGAGFYGVSLTVSISSSDPSIQIRYTTDGSEPTESSTLYSSPLTVSSTQVIRAKTFGGDYYPGNSVSQTYYIHAPDYTMQVVSLSTTPANLWDNTIGIYVQGTNGITGNCMDYPVNWNQDWERPVSIEYFEKDKTAILQQNAGIKIFGGCTRSADQKSVAITARNEYGDNSFDYKFFADKDVDKFKNVVLRNSGNDVGETMFRDAFMQSLVKDRMDIDYQAYQPVVVYINGEYWGIHGLREKLNEHYISNNYNINTDNINLLEKNNQVKCGDNAKYLALIDYLNSNNLSVSANYQYVASQIDINEYINYMLAQIYVGNTDWPGNNIKYWCPTSKLGKFRWIIYDLDFGFNLSTEPSHNTLTFALEAYGPDWPNPAWSTLLFRKLMQNDEFKTQFAQQMDFHMNTTFETSRMLGLIDQFEDLLAPEMPRHIARWGRPYNIAEWINNINSMRDFANQRNAYMRQHLSNYLGLSGTVNVTVYNPDTLSGWVSLNGNTIKDTLFQGEFIQGLPLNISIIPKNGYNISHWEITPKTKSEQVLINSGDNWKYLSNGTDQGESWKTKSFDDSGWSNGTSQFGYGDGDESTTLDYGTDSDNKYITYYFRKEVVINPDFKPDELTLSIMKDDGAVVYINNSEVLRSNLPTGAINYSTTALSAVGGNDENTFAEFSIDTAFLNSDTNIIAVEIHQVSGTSSDISFDFALKAVKYTLGETVTTYNYPLHQNGNESIIVQPVFEQSNTIDSLYINEFMCENKNSIMDNRGQFEDWIEIYNAGSKPVNIEGLYLTDDLNNPTRFVIPGGFPEQTSIQPHGFAVIWADDDTSQGPLHTNFKLDNDWEQIAICKVEDTIVTILDSLEFGPQLTDASSGSYPDGSKSRMTFGIITPGAPNNNTPYSKVEPVLADQKLTLYPNPTDGWLNIKLHSANAENVMNDCRIEIYTITGQIQYTETIKMMDNTEFQLDMNGYNPGIYIIRVQTGQNIITGKVYKK